jgi:argininosuccinate lyase
MKLWKKSFDLNKAVENYTVGIDFVLDLALVPHDCDASLAHAKMLKKIGVLNTDELKKLISGLAEIKKLHSQGKFVITPEDEDCHTAIENHLTKKCGAVGKKIHTFRSRNDQVLTALRLYYKSEIKEILALVDNAVKSMSVFKKKNGSVVFPGYTHTRKAMPSSIGLWTGCFIDSMKDNKLLLQSVLKLIDQSPLGTAAGYGVPAKIDRKFSAKLMGFAKVQDNPMYAQMSRGKFESSLLHVLSQVMFDLHKVATDLILWSMPQFGFFSLPNELTTGSSIMPQKKNPDVLELMRAKYHTVCAAEFEVKGLTGNLISGYHRDMQLLKGPTMKSLDIVKESLPIASLLFNKLVVHKDKCKQAMTSELFATEKAYKLVEKGMPFRDAYKKVSKEFE